jgi:prophage tail gpP-like protein
LHELGGNKCFINHFLLSDETFWLDKWDDPSRLTLALMVFCPPPRPCKKKKSKKKNKKQKTKTKHKSYGSAFTMTPKANLH